MNMYLTRTTHSERIATTCSLWLQKGCYTCLQCTCSHPCSREITLTHHQNEVAHLYLLCGEKEKKINSEGKESSNRDSRTDKHMDRETEPDRQANRNRMGA